jgi:hypothetical protein
MRLNARKINHRMKQSLQFKTTTILTMPRRTPLHRKQTWQHNKDFVKSNSLEDSARQSPKYIAEAPTNTDTAELEAQVSSKSKLCHNKKRYSDDNIKREGESTIDFSTRLNAHIVASKNKSAKTGGSKRQKRNRTTIINDQDKSTDFHSNSKDKLIPLIQTTLTTTKETPCYGIDNSTMTLNETLGSAKDFVGDGIESRNDQETNDYMINDDLKTESESEQLCSLWTKNKQLAHEVFNMQEAVRDQSFDCNVRSLSESNANRKRSSFFLDDPQFDLPLEEQTQEQRNRMNQNDITRNIFICNT